MDKNHTFWLMKVESSGFLEKEKWELSKEEDEACKGVSKSDGTVIEARIFECLT